ncbi:rhombosortase [Neorhodopirellula pilleata]|uniref:Rhomboid family protein n=1 Tax=Neorhodopirellula pilleata TaxID=2714738 RepID=A0A5C6A9H5_9BACT|nr:rhombosortase [Neorhodopirellula pilleata]TWT95691.1 Rhomboid family protein [Neorhodopirellula pilleata]
MSINATTVTVPSSEVLPSADNEGWRSVINLWGNAGLHRVPLTLFLSMIALAAFISPSLTSTLQLDFASVASGQWWRLITGHLTHYGGDHLFWDLLMFAVLGAVCEHQHPRLFGVSVIVMSLGISATVLATCSHVSAYRGLSGIDTGLCVWFIVDQIRQSRASRDRLFAILWIAAGTILIGKLVFECATGEILFVDANGFQPLVQSHLAGATFGVMFASIAIYVRRLKR